MRRAIIVIDDDDAEKEMWAIIKADYFPEKIDVKVFQEIEAGINYIASSPPHIVIMDCNIPPHADPKFISSELDRIDFKGRKIVFSNHDKSYLDSILNISLYEEVISKQSYMGIKGMIKFVEDFILQN